MLETASVEADSFGELNGYENFTHTGGGGYPCSNVYVVSQGGQFGSPALLTKQSDEGISCVHTNTERNPRPILVRVSGRTQELDCTVQGSPGIVRPGDTRNEVPDGFVPGEAAQ